MSYTVIMLNAASTPGPGPAVVFNSPRIVTADLQFSWTGSPTDWFIQWEYTIDGINWAEQDIKWTTNQQFIPPIGFIQTFGAVHVSQVRLNLVSLSGGASPTVTVTAAITEDS
jgi:hypothetical protein